MIDNKQVVHRAHRLNYVIEKSLKAKKKCIFLSVFFEKLCKNEKDCLAV